MRRHRTKAIRFIILAFALRGLLGAECGGDEAPTWVALVPEVGSVATYSVFTVDVQVTSATPVQAFEMGIQWDPQMLLPRSVLPHPDFDDDGSFFIDPRFDLMGGKLDRVVDLRHGGSGAEGSFKIATVEFLSLGVAGPTTIGVTSGGMAGPDGVAPCVTHVVPVTIEIEP
jgi:hypothetical protein